MKALVFAAGLGTRLRPLTDTMPKALVPVAGVPMLERVVCKLRDAGLGPFVVNVHHFAEQIEVERFRPRGEGELEATFIHKDGYEEEFELEYITFDGHILVWVVG